MNKLSNVLKADLYKSLNNKGFYATLFIVACLTILFISISLAKDKTTDIQYFRLGFNPYFSLIAFSLNFPLSKGVLPLILSLLIFTNLKLNENLSMWVYGLNTQAPLNYLFGKLIVLLLVWVFFLAIIFLLHIFLIFLISYYYPDFFLGYEPNHQFLFFWFLKYYISSLGNLTLFFLVNILIQSRAVILILTLFLPYMSIYFSLGGIFNPISYSVLSTNKHYEIYVNQLAKKNDLSLNYDFKSIITAYEIFSLIIVISCILFIVFNQKRIVGSLIKH